MKLRKILARVSMGDRTYFTGDGYFQSVSVSLGEGDRSSTCTYTISDPKLKIGQALFAQSFDSEGIEVPPDLLAAPEPPPDTSSDGPGQIFENLSDLPGDGQLIVNECGKQGMIDIPSIAYVMATTQHETDNTFKPIDEYGGPGLSYAPYYGRGFVQLTHLENYSKYAQLTGKDLVNNPDLVKEPATAAFIMVHGFLAGNFTGVGIRDYIAADGSKKDYVNCRKVINGTDRAALIAGYAQEWETKLSGLTKKDTPETPSPEPDSAIAPPPTLPAPGTPGALADKADTKPTQSPQKSARRAQRLS